MMEFLWEAVGASYASDAFYAAYAFYASDASYAREAVDVRGAVVRYLRHRRREDWFVIHGSVDPRL